MDVEGLPVSLDSGIPLLRAVFLRRLRLTRLLLEGGAYINESDARGQTPLMVACGTPYADSQSASRVRLVQFLLEKGADPNIQDKDGRSALIYACRERAGPEVVALLLARGADVGLEDRTGTSALVHAVSVGDWKVLKLLLDSCKAKGKEVIIIATDKFPSGDPQAKQYLSMPPPGPGPGLDPAPASPSEIQLITSPQGATAGPPKTSFTFKDAGGVTSNPCSPSRRIDQTAASNGLQLQPLLRLNSEPWLKIPASLGASSSDLESLRGPRLDGNFRWYEAKLARDEGPEGKNECGVKKEKISLPGLLSSHSASHPNLHSASHPSLGSDPIASSSSVPKNLGPLASSSLHSIIQRRKIGSDIYSSDPQLARDIYNVPEESQSANKDPTEAKRLAPLRCSSTLGSRESLVASGPTRRVLAGYERRGSGAFLLDHNSAAALRPRSLPPLALNATNVLYGLGSGGGPGGPGGTGFSERDWGLKGFLPAAPPGHPKELTRRMLLRRHSMQTEQFKSTA